MAAMSSGSLAPLEGNDLSPPLLHDVLQTELTLMLCSPSC